MFAVIFEVHPNDGRKDDYLDLAKHLKPILEKIDGFVDNERFESKLRPGWVLSHSTWRDEKSVVRWRTEGEHHVVQVDQSALCQRANHVLPGGEVIEERAAGDIRAFTDLVDLRC